MDSLGREGRVDPFVNKLGKAKYNNLSVDPSMQGPRDWRRPRRCGAQCNRHRATIGCYRPRV